MWFSQTPIATQGRKVCGGVGGENKEEWGEEKNKHVRQENAAEREKKEDKQPIGKKENSQGRAGEGGGWKQKTQRLQTAN